VVRAPLAARVMKAFWARCALSLCHELAVQRWREAGVEVSPTTTIARGADSRLELGTGSAIGPYTILDLTDDPHGRMGGGSTPSTLIIGPHTVINEFNNIRAAGGQIRIGSHCLISQFVSIIASNHMVDGPELIKEAPWNRSNNWVEIGDDVWIGAHAVVLPGVRIGQGAVIAAGSVVTRDVPESAVVAGVPATFRRFRVRESVLASGSATSVGSTAS
jgi:acetyltransferase-like isoleucine patch superfamily enzyme